MADTNTPKLTADYCDETWTVLDEAGGRWWPNDEAKADIASSDDPGAAAIRMAETQPMRGEWHS